jgi:alanyl-tRNA synthetase
MKYLTGSQIRSMWLEFFKEKGHEIIPSANLIPVNDPTLLWINAGVAPLKKYFDGREKPVNPRMTNAQKSIRTNDIENVGKTARHHTFFEMLGNFSVGDYFREEVIGWAYELLFSSKWFGFDQNRLYMTYYTKDLATKKRWMEVGVKEDHLIPLDGNFWEIGEGPCGPDTEMFFDRGEAYDPEHIGLRLLKEDMENDRYIEIWNIVFSQFNSIPGKPRETYPELPSKNIDTGSGLERLACVIQETETNYETDLFLPMLNYLENYTKRNYKDNKMAFRVIMDHVRSVTFAIADGAILSNEGRGYVLRRLVRRAIRYGRKLGIREPFLYKMVGVVVDTMKDFYPYLVQKQAIVEKLVKTEEENFLRTLENGEKKLEDILNATESKVVSGKDAFLLYDTFGFPLELTVEASNEKGYEVDVDGFGVELEAQKNRARAARSNEESMNIQNSDFLNFHTPTTFVGYDTLEKSSTITGIFKDGKNVSSANGECILTFNETPFYGEMGGQVGDQGTLSFEGETYQIYNTIKLPNGQQAHCVDMKDTEVKVGETMVLTVDESFRRNVAANHSATHLVNEALRKVLGNHVVQHGSFVSDTSLHFDFNHYENLTNEEILEVEKIVNQKIAEALPVNTTVTTVDEAKKKGAQALFSEKYGSSVRLVEMGDFSKELCGGTHVANTSEIEKCVILGVESKGSGIFRISCATKDNVWTSLEETLAGMKKDLDDLDAKKEKIMADAKLANITLPTMNIVRPTLKGSYSDILSYRNCTDESKKAIKELEKAYDIEYRRIGSQDYTKYTQGMKQTEKGCILVERVDGVDLAVLKDIVDKICASEEKIFVFFADVMSETKVMFLAKSKNTPYVCGQMVKNAAIICGGNGGGRPDFAQAGGKDATKVDEAIQMVVKSLA